MTLMETIETKNKPIPLSKLSASPDRFITKGLFKYALNPSSLHVVQFPIWLGRADQEYQPSLSILICERIDEGCRNLSSELDRWSTVLEYHRKLALDDGLITPYSRPLLSIVANEFAETGVNIRTFVIAEYLRNKGIGSEFMGYFESLLCEMGYDYYFGITFSAIDFFRKTGSATWDDLDNSGQEYLNLAKLATSEESSRGIFTVRFLKPLLEEGLLL